MLCTQPMDDGESGSVLRDFEPLLAFIGDNTPPVRPKYPLLPMGSLAPLNAQMTRPMQLGLKRPQQRASAHLHALYLSERIDPVVRAIRKARMLESHGEAPCSPQGQTIGKREERPRGQPA
jgi:hypothetical protein